MKPEIAKYWSAYFAAVGIEAAWQRLTRPSLVPRLPGHKEGVEVKNNWPPVAGMDQFSPPSR